MISIMYKLNEFNKQIKQLIIEKYELIVMIKDFIIEKIREIRIFYFLIKIPGFFS